MTTTMRSASSSERFVDVHRDTLEAALRAIRARAYWSVFPEHPAAYGEQGASEGERVFSGYRGAQFPLEQAGIEGWSGSERSPYGIPLEISYPVSNVDALLAAMREALPSWRDATPDVRAGVCVEMLQRLNHRSHEIAHAVMHTTGQAYMMAFQAGGPHAQDRGLEAIAYAYAEMTKHAPEAIWEKPQGKRAPLRLHKRFRIAPRGVALVIGCNTFPTWNSYPGLFASLVTGNPVLVKPSRRAILPLAITVAVAREVLAEAGFSPDLVALAVDAPGKRTAQALALRSEVRIIDYTGSSEFGEWLEQNARQAVVFTEKAGVNTVVVDSTGDYGGMLANLAFTLSLYSGQMCTTTQNLLVPRGGIATDEGHKSFREVASDLGEAIDTLLVDIDRATAILGAIVNEAVLGRLDEAEKHGELVRRSQALEHPQFPEATVWTPLLVALDAATDDSIHLSEQFGPISFVVATDDTAASLELLCQTTLEQGAITAGIYSTSADVLAAAEEVALEAGVALSCNLTGGIYVNQSAAFSDFHATGANPAANSTFTDGAYVASRFRVVQSRRPLAEEA